MNKTTILTLVGVAVILGVIAFVVMKSPQPTGPQPIATTSSSTGASTSGMTGGAVASGGSSGTTSGGTSSGLRVLIPAYGDVWLLNKTHTIQWSALAGYSGGIELLDAASRAQIGWIEPNLLRSQVQYSWNTDNVMVSRTAPARKTVVPGTYIFRIVFDGPRAPIESSPFRIVDSGDEYSATQSVTVKNVYFTPNALTIHRGVQLVITNDDPTAATILMNGAVIAKLSQWSSYVFNSAAYAPGTYELRIKEQVLARLTITVQQ